MSTADFYTFYRVSEEVLCGKSYALRKQVLDSLLRQGLPL